MSILIAVALAQAVSSNQMGQMRPRMDPAARAAHRFQMMDTNHDGVISKAEFVAAHERMREHRMERRQMGGQGGWQHQGQAPQQ